MEGFGISERPVRFGATFSPSGIELPKKRKMPQYLLVLLTGLLVFSPQTGHSFSFAGIFYKGTKYNTSETPLYLSLPPKNSFNYVRRYAF